MSEPTGGLATLGINLPVFIAQLVNFLLVLLVLWKFAYKPIVRMLDERSKKIEESVSRAKEIEQRLFAMDAEQQEVLSQAKADASRILDLARLDAEKRKHDLLESAKREVERVVVQGKEQLKTEKQQMIREAKAELIDIALIATKKILEETIDEKKSHTLAEIVVKKMTSV
jgi:F-type H+-transporting ATPase subunit b